MSALACGRSPMTLALPGQAVAPAPFTACARCLPGGCVVRSAAHIRGAPADQLRDRVLRHDRRHPERGAFTDVYLLGPGGALL